MLEAIGRPEIPVIPGARKPFCREAHHAPEIHGTGDHGPYKLYSAHHLQGKVALMGQRSSPEPEEAH